MNIKNLSLVFTIVSAAIVTSGCQKKLVVINGCAIQPNTVCLDANLDFVNLEGANLEGANLSGSTFWGSNLKGANLKGAILSDVTIGNAHTNRGKIEANLENTNFTNSFIGSSRIEGIGIESASFQGASICQVQFPDSISYENDCDSDKKFQTLHEVREYSFQ